MADSGHLSQRNLEVVNNKILLNGDNQGEYKRVVISAPFFLLARSLLYTAVRRMKAFEINKVLLSKAEWSKVQKLEE